MHWWDIRVSNKDTKCLPEDYVYGYVYGQDLRKYTLHWREYKYYPLSSIPLKTLTCLRPKFIHIYTTIMK